MVIVRILFNYGCGRRARSRRYRLIQKVVKSHAVGMLPALCYAQKKRRYGQALCRVGLREIPHSDAVGALFLPWRQYRQKNAAHRGWQETSHGAANLPGESLIHQTVPNVRLAATGVVNLHLS